MENLSVERRLSLLCHPINLPRSQSSPKLGKPSREGTKIDSAKTKIMVLDDASVAYKRSCKVLVLVKFKSSLGVYLSRPLQNTRSDDF